VRAAGLITIQDLGRPGRMHEALPPGGALVPELLIAANRAARNPDGAAALEVLGRLVVRAASSIEVATDRARELGAGDELVVESEPRRAAYLAVRGGLAAPLVLGGRGAHLSAGLGRALRAGDLLEAGDARTTSPAAPPPLGDGPIRLVAGPDAFAPEALALLGESEYRILPTSDRVGTRLDGPPLPVPAGRDASHPMVRGALEVPPDGRPIVLGPEHPTTGGYAIAAVIAHADLGRFFAIRLGGHVRFVIADTVNSARMRTMR
jgi:allophanate hydrolase subunit 2